MRTSHLALLALAIAGCTAPAASPDQPLGLSQAGKDDGAPQAVMLMQKHAQKFSVVCDYPDGSACDITFKLTPPPRSQEDTLLLFSKKLKGLHASDLSFRVVREVYRPAAPDSIGAEASLVLDDGFGDPGPQVGALDDGTPVYFRGDQMHFTQRANTTVPLELLIEPGFWYNEVTFNWSADFTPIAAF